MTGCDFCVWPPRELQSAPQRPHSGPELAEGLPGQRAAAADQEEETGGWPDDDSGQAQPGQEDPLPVSPLQPRRQVPIRRSRGEVPETGGHTNVTRPHCICSTQDYWNLSMMLWWLVTWHTGFVIQLCYMWRTLLWDSISYPNKNMWHKIKDYFLLYIILFPCYLLHCKNGSMGLQ